MAIVNLDKVLSGANGNLESVVAFDKNNKLVADYANGLFVDVDGFVQDHSTDWVGRKGEAKYGVVSVDGTKDTVMLHAPELQYDEKKFMRDFRNEAGKVVRGYRLQRGDVLTMTDQAIGLSVHGDVVVGDTLVVKDGKLAKATAPVEGEAVVSKLSFKVIADAGNTLDIVEKAWTLQVQ